ncbi:MAG TPA: phosphate/phosphite/phosphonate ABC transporter substrate-binding protein [Polyangiaceae bacterium]
MDFVVLGYAAPDARSKMRQRMSALAARLAELAGIDVGVTPAPSYEKLAQYIHRGEVDLAWLSPISLVSLARMKRVRPMASMHRKRSLHYRCAILVRAGSHMSSFEELRGKRAAWVDRHSASGYVLPRIELAAHGIGPRDLGGERFCGSHDGVVRAIASGRADFGATFAHTQNGVTTGAWNKTAGLSRSVSVLTTFGEVPPDAIAARYDLPTAVREKLTRAVIDLGRKPDDRALLSEVLGADEIRIPKRATYEPLRAMVFRAYQSGLLHSEGSNDDVLDVAATLEQRQVTIPPDPPTARKLPADPKPRKRRADETQEAEIIEIVG